MAMAESECLVLVGDDDPVVLLLLTMRMMMLRMKSIIEGLQQGTPHYQGLPTYIVDDENLSQPNSMSSSAAVLLSVVSESVSAIHC